MVSPAVRLHRIAVEFVQSSAILLVYLGVLIAFVGIPTFVTRDGSLHVLILPDPILWALLLVAFGILETVTVHWGEFKRSWIAALGLVLFAVGFYPNAGHLVAPMVGFNVLSLAALHGLDEWLVRF